MADLAKTVEILFKGTDETSKTLDTISGSISSFSGKIQSATEPLANFSLFIEKIDAALAALVVGGLALSVNAYSTFENTMIRVRGVMNVSETDYERLTELTRNLGRDTQYTAQQAAEGLLVLAQAGIKTDEAITMLPNILKFAQAAMLDIPQVSDMAMIAMKNFGLTVEAIPRISDAFISSANNANVTIMQMAEALKMVSPVANGLGMSLEETLSILGKLADAGFKGEMGGTALRNILIALVAPTDNAGKLFKKLGVDTTEMGLDMVSAKDALKSMGVQMADSHGNMLPFPNILDQIITKIRAMNNPMEETGLMMGVFGKRGGPQMKALIDQGTGSIQELLNKILSSGGITEEMGRQVETGLKQTIKIMESSIEAIGLSVGKAAKTGVVAGGSGIIDTLNAITSEIDKGTFKPLFDVFESLGIDTRELFKGIAKALPEALGQVDFSKFTGSLKELGGSIKDIFEALFGKFDLSKPEDLAKALQKVVDAGTKLSEFSVGIAEGLKPFAEKLGEWADKALAADTETVKLSGRMSGFGQGVNTVVTALNLLGPAIGLFSGALIIDGIATIGKLAVALTSIPVTATVAGLVVLGYAANSLNPPIDLATAKFDEFGNLIGDFNDIYAPGIKNNLEQIGGAFKTAGEKAQEGMNEIGKIGLAKLLPDISFVIHGDTLEAVEKVSKFKEEIKSLDDYSNWTLNTRIDAQDELNNLIAEINRLSKGSAIVLSTDKESVQKSLDVVSMMKNSMFTQAISLPVVIESDSLMEAKAKVDGFIVDENGRFINIKVGSKYDEIEKAKKELDERIPTEKMLEIKLQGNIDKELTMIKTSADTVQKSMEWTAKVEIAQVEGDANRMASAFEAASSGVESYSKELSSLFSKNWDNFDWTEFRAARDSAEQGLKLQKEMHDAEMKLLEAQTSYERAKRIRLESNKALIKIDSTGLEPQLEMIMWQILKKVQMRANEDGANFLLGIK